MINLHLITPPPELERQWIDNDDFPFATGTLDLVSITKDRLRSIATQAARWGADQDLEACCEWLEEDNPGGFWSGRLRAARRPKPPSLKAQALHILYTHGNLTRAEADTIRRALEQLDD